MDGYPPSSEIIDTQYTADNIPAQIVKYQHLPDRVAILVEYRS
jgi:hypothetical protein